MSQLVVHKRFSAGFEITLLGTLAIFTGLLTYPAVLSRIVFTADSLGFLEPLAYATLTLLLTGILGVTHGVSRILRFRAVRTKMLGGFPSSTLSMLAHVLADKPYGRISNLSALAYGIFFAFVSSMIVYRPWQQFSEAYQARIPSIVVVACCGSIGQVPQFVAYPTEHLGFLITPISVILLFAISWLVGLNTSLALFAYRNRPQGVGGKWLGGFGATVGLFTGCPACAGLIFSAVAGGAGAVSIATAFASLQALFIALSLPVLVATPLFMARNLLKVFGGRCAPTK